MQKIAIVYWSGTGNTEAMAELVAQGAARTGAQVSVIQVSDFLADRTDDFGAFAFGCPAMGDEELEDTEFLPIYDSVEPHLHGREVVLFGSCEWSDGEWMRRWVRRAAAAGIVIVGTVISRGYPNTRVAEECIMLGSRLAD